jgi:soluble lytic murein transglycosylase-like protein
VIPTLHDVKGAPVPGLTGAAATPPPHQDFRLLLKGMLEQRAAGSAPAGGRSLAAPGRVRSAARSNVPVREPAFQPRVLVPAGQGVPTRPGRVGREGAVSSGAARSTARVPKAPCFVAPAPAAAPRVTGRSARKTALVSAIHQASRAAGVPPALSVAVARAESSLNPNAVSPDGRSVGTFQVLHSTKAEMRRKIAAGTVDRPPGPDDVALGVGYLRYLHDLFGRTAKLGRGLETVAIDDAHQRRLFAVAAFNAGEGRVARAQARAASAGLDPTRFDDVRPFLPVTTRGYVERVKTFAREEDPTATLV